MKEAIFVDHSGSVFYNTPLLISLLDIARGINPNAGLFAFSDGVAPLSQSSRIAGGPTDFIVIERFLRTLSSYPDKVTVVTDGNAPMLGEGLLFPERWNYVMFDGNELKTGTTSIKTLNEKSVEEQVPPLRCFIYGITQDKAKSPMAEAEIEEIARCALRGGYKFDVDAFAASFGRFMLDMPVDN